jgi:hypothetical protein
MAKNNFKKKKTLKRSFRRNHTKKVASASLGSRTPNIRKKNRRSQKQRTTLRNKRNARAKIGGAPPSITGAPPSITGAPPSITGAPPSFTDTIMEHLKAGTINNLLTDQKKRIAEFDIKAELEEEKQRRNAEQYTWDPEREAMRHKEIEEKRKNTERNQRNNNTAIQHKLKHICEEMHNVKDDKREHLLFDAAEKLINSKELSLSDKDIEAAKQEVLDAQNEGARRHGRSPRKDWFFTYKYGGTEHTPAYIDTEYQYKYPPAIEYNTRMLEEEIINNPYSLQWPSEYNRYKMFEDDEDDEDE